MRNIHFLNGLLIVAAVIVFFAVSQISIGAEEVKDTAPKETGVIGIKTKTTSDNLGVDLGARTGVNIGRESEEFDDGDLDNDGDRDRVEHVDRDPEQPGNQINERKTRERTQDTISDEAPSLKNAGEFRGFDRNEDGTLTEAEFKAKLGDADPEKLFEDFDTNKDGRLDQIEFDVFADAQADANVRAAQ